MKSDPSQPQVARSGEVVTLAHWTAQQAERRQARTVRDAAPPQLALALDLERERRQVFVSTLAHELRQPLSTISAAMDIVRLAPATASAARAVDIMQRQLGQMNRVVEDLLDETRWARGKVALRKERLDIRAVVRDAALDIAADAAARRHALVVTVGPEPLYVDADPQRLHQVLSNLLRNAVKYTEPGGCITLDAERGVGAIILRVTDTGRGIAAAALPHVFDLFSQVRPSEGTGVGIGLSVAREVVSLHGGRIEARSAGAGLGSEFTVTLPLAAAAFLIEIIPPLVWNPLPATTVLGTPPDDAGDLGRMDDDGAPPA